MTPYIAARFSSEHQHELSRSTTHHIATSECKEMFILFTPRGGATRSLTVTELPAVVTAIQKLLRVLPKTNLVVSLLNARNLELKVRFTFKLFHHTFWSF